MRGNTDLELRESSLSDALLSRFIVGPQLVDENQIFRTSLQEEFSYDGYAVTSATQANDTPTLLAMETFAAVVTNLTDNRPQKITYKNTQRN